MNSADKREPLSLRDFVLPFLVYTGLFLLIWRPDLSSFQTVFWHTGGDGYQNAWNIWWVHKAILDQGSNPWFTNYLHAPDGVTLIGATLNAFNGFLTLPFRDVLTLEGCYNFSFAFSYIVAGMMAYLLVREIGASRLGSFVAGAAFTFCSYHTAHGLGHLQLIAIEWLPGFLWVWLRFLREPNFRHAAAAALLLFLTILCDYYYFLYAVLTGLILITHRLIMDRRDSELLKKKGSSSVLVFALLTLCSSGMLVYSLLSANHRDPFIGAHDPAVFGLDLPALFIPGGTWVFRDLTRGFWSRLGVEPVEADVFLGWTTIVISGYGFLTLRHASKRLWLGILVFFLLLSIGPRLRFFGHFYEDAWTPYQSLTSLLPFFDLGGMPNRMAAMVSLAAAVLAGISFEGFRERFLRGFAPWLLFLGVFLVEHMPFKLPQAQLQNPAYVNALKELPDGIVDIPEAHTDELLYQCRFDKPITGGYVARIPRSRAHSLQALKDDRAAARMPARMRRQGIRYIVRRIHKDVIRAQDLRAIYRDATHEIWVLPEDPLAKSALPTGREVQVQSKVQATANGNRLVLYGLLPAKRKSRVAVYLTRVDKKPCWMSIAETRSTDKGQFQTSISIPKTFRSKLIRIRIGFEYSPGKARFSREHQIQLD